jgi:hypothetical protein
LVKPGDANSLPFNYQSRPRIMLPYYPPLDKQSALVLEEILAKVKITLLRFVSEYFEPFDIENCQEIPNAKCYNTITP